jgi:glycerophosphoryl diester phosphodiesterase
MKTVPSISTLQAGLLLVGGIGMGMLLTVLSPDRAMGDWYLHPGLLIPPLYLVSVTFSVLLPGSEGRHFWFATGALCVVAPHLTTRPGMGVVELEFFDPANIQVTALVGGTLVATGLLLKGLSRRRAEPKLPQLVPNFLPLAWVMALLFYLAFRVSHQFSLDIPNEERSLMIRGVEVHHLNLGLIALVLAGFLRTWGMRGGLRWLGLLMYGVGAALYLDESVYICLAEVTDAAYAGTFSTGGGILAIALWILGTDRLVRRVYRSGPQPTRPPGLDSASAWVIGHRGAAGLVDENTVESIARATEVGVPMVEIDVGLSSDGDLFLMHDFRVDRTTNGSGFLSDLDSEHVRQLRTPGGFEVPSLERVLSMDQLENVILFIDMKSLSDTTDTLENHGIEQYVGRIILDYQRLDEASEVKQAFSNCSVVISPFLPFYLAETAIACRVDGVDIYHQAFSASAVTRLAAHGMIRTCWYTSDPEIAERKLKMNIDGIMSDRPDLLIHLCKSRGS